MCAPVAELQVGREQTERALGRGLAAGPELLTPEVELHEDCELQEIRIRHESILRHPVAILLPPRASAANRCPTRSCS